MLEETGLPISLHFHTGSQDHLPESAGEEQNGGFLTYMVTGMAEGIVPVSVFVSSGVLARHPSMHTVIVECGAGWLPWVLYTMDDQYERKHMWIEPKLDMKPSEYFKRQGHATFSDDLAALRMIDFIGAEALLWGSDYPHDEGTFPHSQEVIERTFVELSEEDKRKIVYGNSASLYGIGGMGHRSAGLPLVTVAPFAGKWTDLRRKSMAGLKAISADSHVQEAPELFETRVPEEFSPDFRTWRKGEDGAKYRVVEGRKKRRFDIAAENINEDDMEREFRLDPSGGTDIPYRLKDQDRDGVTAEVLYPNSLLALFASPDPNYQIAVARAL